MHLVAYVLLKKIKKFVLLWNETITTTTATTLLVYIMFLFDVW